MTFVNVTQSSHCVGFFLYFLFFVKNCIIAVMNRLRLFLLLVLCVAVSLVGCKNSSDEITSIEQLNDSRFIVGACLGESAVVKIQNLLPNDKLAYKVLSGIAKSISWDEGNSVTILL